MRKIISIILASCIILLSLSIPFSAFESSDFKTKTIEFNEWDEYQRISSMSNQQLTDLGYSKSEISAIKNFDYEAEIRKRAALDDATLKLYKYTPTEIQKLRAAAAMDEIPISVMKSISTATMTTRLKYVEDGSRQEAGKKMYYVNLRFFWQWNKMPFFRLFDMIAIAFTSSTSNQFTYCAQSNQIIRIKYSAVAAGATDYKRTLTWNQDSSKVYCIYKDFSIELKDLNNLPTHFAFYGYGAFQLTNRSKNARLYVDAAYGHTTVRMTPNFSLEFSKNPISCGIDFSFGMDEQHCTGYFYENFTIANNYIYHGTVYGKNNTGGNAS